MSAPTFDVEVLCDLVCQHLKVVLAQNQDLLVRRFRQQEVLLERLLNPDGESGSIHAPSKNSLESSGREVDFAQDQQGDLAAISESIADRPSSREESFMTITLSSHREGASDRRKCASERRRGGSGSTHKSLFGVSLSRPWDGNHRSKFSVTASRAVYLEDSAPVGIIEANDNRLFGQVVSQNWFETIFALLIISNGIFVGIQVQYQSTQHTRDVPFAMDLISHLYTFLFTVELLMRLRASWKEYLCGSQWTFNYLDITVVVTSWIEFILRLAVGQTGEMQKFTIVRILRLLRIMRILRAVKTMRIFRDFRVLVNSLRACLRSLLWAMCFLVLILYLFGVLFAQTVSDHMLEGHESDNARLERLFGSLFEAMFTLFKGFTGGIDWDEIVDPLFDVGAGLPILFVGYLSFMVFAVMNIITGLFCENAIHLAQLDHEEVISDHLQDKRQHARQLQNIFEAIENNSCGEITLEEFEEFCQDPRVVAYFDYLSISIRDVANFFTMLDVDGSLSVTLEEFVEGVLALKGPARSIDVQMMMAEQGKLSRSLKQLESSVRQLSKSYSTSFQSRTVTAHRKKPDPPTGDVAIFEPSPRSNLPAESLPTVTAGISPLLRTGLTLCRTPPESPAPGSERQMVKVFHDANHYHGAMREAKKV